MWPTQFIVIICTYFGITIVSCTNDVTNFVENNPELLPYDPSSALCNINCSISTSVEEGGSPFSRQFQESSAQVLSKDTLIDIKGTRGTITATSRKCMDNAFTRASGISDDAVVDFVVAKANTTGGWDIVAEAYKLVGSSTTHGEMKLPVGEYKLVAYSYGTSQRAPAPVGDQLKVKFQPEKTVLAYEGKLIVTPEDCSAGKKNIQIKLSNLCAKIRVKIIGEWFEPSTISLSNAKIQGSRINNNAWYYSFNGKKEPPTYAPADNSQYFNDVKQIESDSVVHLVTQNGTDWVTLPFESSTIELAYINMNIGTHKDDLPTSITLGDNVSLAAGEIMEITIHLKNYLKATEGVEYITIGGVKWASTNLKMVTYDKNGGKDPENIPYIYEEIRNDNVLDAGSFFHWNHSWAINEGDVIWSEYNGIFEHPNVWGGIGTGSMSPIPDVFKDVRGDPCRIASKLKGGPTRRLPTTAEIQTMLKSYLGKSGQKIKIESTGTLYKLGLGGILSSSNIIAGNGPAKIGVAVDGDQVFVLPSVDIKPFKHVKRPQTLLEDILVIPLEYQEYNDEHEPVSWGGDTAPREDTAWGYSNRAVTLLIGTSTGRWGTQHSTLMPLRCVYD